MNIVYQEPMNNNVKEGARNSTQSLIVATPTSCIYVRFTVCTKSKVTLPAKKRSKYHVIDMVKYFSS